jgi:predicted RNA-binding Zn ribbon-like protein
MNEFDGFLVGGLVGVDFCNTFDHLHTPPTYDFLPDQKKMILWAQAARILPSDYQDPVPSNDLSLAKIKETRSLIFRLLYPFVHSSRPAQEDLDLFSARLQQVSTRMRITLQGNGYSFVCDADDPLERIECAVIRSIADFLLSQQTGWLKECGVCGWLFYDTSRNHSRRWCTMRICGNRAKAHRHYQRVQQQSTTRALTQTH